MKSLIAAALVAALFPLPPAHAEPCVDPSARPPDPIVSPQNCDDPAAELMDPATCPVLALLAGDYGAVVINSQGDVFVAGEPFWDCPPYDISR